MCGEHPLTPKDEVMQRGSSPHVRGALPGKSTGLQTSGIIPACAGSTTFSRSLSRLAWDHPRMCGEHQVSPDAQPMWWGSSPHVRGAHQVIAGDAAADGIIPACAGSTLNSQSRLLWQRDHPRMCGEHGVVSVVGSIAVGSSPHVRGALGGFQRERITGGIIPACAGSTTFRRRRRGFYRDHPRMCGEHSSFGSLKFSSTGSSPHVRGALERERGIMFQPGIIPACAGSTLRWC